MSKIAFLFPGQGSQAVGMGKSLFDENENVAKIFQKADETLGYSLSKIIFEGPEETLTLTTNTQPALLTMSMAVLEALKQSNITPDYVAGHSLGEYSALVCAGALSFEDAVFTVHKRGEFMEEAVPAGQGAMAAVLGLEREKLGDICKEVEKSGDVVQLANLNCPGQIVISGSKAGVERAQLLAKEAGARRVIPLQVSGPFHSSLMRPAAEKLASVLDEITIKDAIIPVVANVTAKEMTNNKEIKQKLIEQVYSPVLWEDTVSYLLDQGVTTFIEIGNGNVLSGLVKKINRKVSVYSINDQSSIVKAVEEINGGMSKC